MLAGNSMNASKKVTFIRTISACKVWGDIAANMPPKLPPELNRWKQTYRFFAAIQKKEKLSN